MKNKKTIKNGKTNRFTLSALFIFTAFMLLLNVFVFDINLNNNENSYSNALEDTLSQSAATWGWVNLTNTEIDTKTYYHYENFVIEGRLWYLPTGIGYDGYKITLKIDGKPISQYYNITANGGYFQIKNYTVNGSINIYSSHKIEVEVDTPNTVEYLNFFTIYSGSTSSFSIVDVDRSRAYLGGENLNMTGYLWFDNGTEIRAATGNYYWYNDYNFIYSNTFTTNSLGQIVASILIPSTMASNLTLKLNYSSAPRVNYSETMIYNIHAFSNVSWGLNFDLTCTVGDNYTISGQLSSITDPSISIGNRDVNIYYNGSLIETATISANGAFSTSFTIPAQNGSSTIQVELVHSVTGTIIKSLVTHIVVNPLELAPTPPVPPGATIPFADFLIIFIPILIGVIAVLVVYGYFFLKKQKEESEVVSLELADKIKNLKILKDTGRLEESLSYLFHAIFMELVSARYGREKKEFETIRDFAIVSVKELGLKATVVYPFMTKVESIIYNRPFKISDKDFYSTCDIFSPVYFELTGQNFILNF